MAQQIDEAVLSRQLFTIGKDAQIKMMNTKVLIAGLNGMGAEITKNVLLMSVKSVGLLDNRNACLADLGTNFFLRKEHIGHCISESTHKQFQELNNSVPVRVEKRELTDESLYNDYDIIVLCYLLSEKQSIQINELCRKHNVKMVYAVNRGPFTMIFNDFGDNFVVFDSNGETPLTYIVNEVVGNTIQFIDENFCTLDVGNEVQLDEFIGLPGLNYSENGGKTFKITKRTAYSIEVGDLNQYGKYIKGGKVTEVKPTVTLHYKALKERLNEPGEITFTNMSKMERLRGYQGLYHGLMIFMDKYGMSPKSHDEDDYKKFKSIVDELKVELDENIIKIFCYCNNGFFSPLDTAFGGIAAQEVLKAASGKYTPYCQYMFYDCLEILPDKYLELPKEEFIDNGRYSGQIDIIGKSVQQQIEDLTIFLVGSGAIGCEVLKTWAMMGLSSGKGLIHITDNDNIEKSNLSRQFLFRNNNINQPKSKVASEAVKIMNPEIHIKDYQLRVGEATENIFTKKFFKSLSSVTTALDNVQARMYCDAQCVKYGLAMIEGGTTGTKGNTQSIIPHITQSYSTGSVRDPEEKSIPMCTLHNFPNEIDHTIQWARDRFEGFFKTEIEPIKNYKEQGESYLETLKKESPLVLLENLKLIVENGISKVPHNFKECIEWAREKYDINFVNTIQKLITNFPENTITDEGIPFWHAPKRFPHIYPFNIDNQYAKEFIISASLLRAEIYGIKKEISNEEIIKYAYSLKTYTSEEKKTEDPETEIKELSEEIKGKEIPKVNPIEFEKDDDNNHHIQFITACSNLRAENYCIKPADFLKTKLIAGKIIPAMITTTAVVSGLQCIELIKVIEKKPLEAYHCSFLNLAIGYMDATEPEAVKKTKICEGFEVSIWDKLEFDGNCTVQELCDIISKKYPVEIDSITVGNKLFYCSYLPSGQARLTKKFTEIYKEMYGEDFKNETMTLSLSVCLNDGSDLPDGVEFPDVLLNF
ncbi:ubiquitin-activating enzyme E1, putative [Entamoeba dispar SAW760]|uniref:Ubiquitin-activating enzyme E1, putative n=1 Tax=Entamoeba dispar (strain ATCC PRA-260 / SAW760) TaxID=370354 RepID=B0EFY1_ENTDS|nr:ubiquitin-activating enzyme E1, putative [Entamoeba dispar SAW760]EDR26587.1 ubiquitin-activating enzyme E1, putative [Entamoeba dispar SAW760]|eukprot:EDR26587.1 ubiquitin-activating enzyme E1, putative [Entamoeba dispar SAW760]